MGLYDKFKKKSEPLKTNNLGGCIITKSLYDGSSKLKWMFRENGINLVDNGWRAIGDTDTEEYINIPENNVIVDFDRLVELEPAVLDVYNMPVGTDLEFCCDENGRYFIDSRKGKTIADYKCREVMQTNERTLSIMRGMDKDVSQAGVCRLLPSRST